MPLPFEPVISDLMQSHIFYYHPSFNEGCLRFCRSLNVKALPEIRGHDQYVLKEDVFVRQPILPNQRLDWDARVFSTKALNIFEKNHDTIVYVYEGEQLCGIVHICDYNRPIIGQYFQQLISIYEQGLRHFLTHRGLTNQDLLHTLRKDRREEMDRLGAFQCFYLSDLLKLIKHKNLAGCELFIDTMGHMIGLRNTAMHSKDIVPKSGSQADSAIVYDFKGLQRMTHWVGELKMCISKVRELIYLERAEQREIVVAQQWELLEKMGIEHGIQHFLDYAV